MTTPDQSNQRKQGRLRRVIVLTLSFVVLSLVILTCAGIYFLPGFVESKAKAFVSEQFDRHLTIRKMDLDLFRLTLTLDGVQLTNPDKESVLASFDHLHVALSPETITSFHPVIREIQLVNPFIHIVRNQDGSSNIRDLVNYFSKQKGDPSEKTLFSVNNIQIENGTIRVDDGVHKRTSQISELNVSIPFIANMPSEVDIFVPFGISARFNKDRIELLGKSKSVEYGKTGGALRLQLDRLDLPSYLRYLPFDLGFKLKSGQLSTNLDMTFAKREGDKRPIYVEGDITLHTLWLAESDNRDVLKIPELKIDIAKSDITTGEIHIDRIGLSSPQVVLDRNGSGQWNVERLLVAGNGNAEKAKVEKEKAEKEERATAKKPTLTIDLKQLVVNDGRLGLVDSISGIRLKEAKWATQLGVRWSRDGEGKNAVSVEGSITVQSVLLSDLSNGDLFRAGELKIDIEKSDVLSGKIDIAHVGLKNPQIFLDRDTKGQWNVERLFGTGKPSSGKTDSTGNDKAVSAISWIMELKQLVVSDGQLQFVDRVFAKPVHMAVKNISIAVEKLFLDVSERNVTVDRVMSTGTRVQVVHSMSELLEQYGKEDRKKSVQNAVNKGVEQSGFHFLIKHAGIKDWAFHFENRNVKNPIVTTISRFEISADNLSDNMETPIPFLMQANVNKGTATVKGNVAVSPLDADLTIDLKNIDVRFVQPYIDDYVNLSLRQADLSVKGILTMKQDKKGVLQGQFRGGASVDNLMAVDQLTEKPVISWKEFAFEGLAVNLSPLSVAIDKAKMNDMAARLILLADGRLNLHNILRSKAGGQKSLIDSEDNVLSTDVTKKAVPVAQPVLEKQRVTAASSASKDKPFSLSIGKWIIGNGRVRFTDNFIKPHYTANILNMQGAFIDLSSDPKTQSKLWLKGQVNGAPLVVSGYINPLSDTLTLNIKAEIKGMELAQFSAYTGKYLGYGVEKGKLSYKATYKVENGQLNAENALVLDQLVLGEKVESEEAKDLPIELALSLLKDSNGVIDIQVPIGGSLSDPDFSLSSIIGKVVMNALKKVITAPFAFLTSLNEKEKSLSGMIFEPGSATLSKENTLRLEKIATALIERPQIKLEITGLYDDDVDRKGLGEFILQRKVRALKRRKQGIPSFEEVTVSEKEYPEWVKEVYQNEKLDKPKQLWLFDKELPVSEMEKLLVQHYSSTKDNLRLLADRRAEVVKNWLVLKGNLPDERIYLLASKKGEAEKDVPAHRVDISLHWKN